MERICRLSAYVPFHDLEVAAVGVLRTGAFRLSARAVSAPVFKRAEPSPTRELRVLIQTRNQTWLPDVETHSGSFSRWYCPDPRDVPPERPCRCAPAMHLSRPRRDVPPGPPWSVAVRRLIASCFAGVTKGISKGRKFDKTGELSTDDRPGKSSDRTQSSTT